MQSYLLRCRMKVFRPLEDTFAFFEDPLNLQKITPPWLAFRVIGGQTVEMRKGAGIHYRIRWLGLPLRWKTVIAAYDAPYRFVDMQARGPYKLWHHLHTFESDGTGTIVGDEVTYILPAGWAGRFAHRVMVRRQLEGIFRFRQQALAGLLGKSTVIDQPRVIAGGHLTEQHLAHYGAYQRH